MVEEQTGIKPGHRSYVGALQPVWTQQYKALNAEETQRLIDTAEEWNQRKVPQKIQAKYNRILSHCYLRCLIGL
jgi:hypothetical protein